jgi:predicted nucleotidyltransferase
LDKQVLLKELQPKRLGLNNSTINQIQKIIAQFPHVSAAKIYGSRAKGTYNARSDIDLVLFGRNITRFEIADMLLALNETDIPYGFDLNNYQEIKNAALKEHIDRVAVTIFKRN